MLLLIKRTTELALAYLSPEYMRILSKITKNLLRLSGRLLSLDPALNREKSINM